MKLERWWLAAALFFLLPLAALRAQDEPAVEPVEEPMEEPAEEPGDSMDDAMAELRAMFTAMIEFTGDERLSEEEMKTVLAHAEAMDSLYEDEDEDPLEDRLNARYEETGKYDIGLVLEDPRYRELVAAAEVDGRKFLRLFLRATLLASRTELAEQTKSQEESLAEQEAQIERMREQFGEEAAARMKKALDDARKAMDTVKEMVAKIPAPTDEEKEVFAKHGEELRKILGGGDDDEEDGDMEDMDPIEPVPEEEEPEELEEE